MKKSKIFLVAGLTALLGVGVASGLSLQKSSKKVEAAYGESGKITIYFAGVDGFAAITGIQIAVNDSWDAATATSDFDAQIGQYKYQYTTASNQTKLNAYMTSHDGKDQWFHPTSGSKDWNTDYSTINLGSVTPLVPGHSYVISFTDWDYNYDNWEHAWFKYSFAEFDIVDPAVTTNQFYVSDPHNILGSTFENVKVYGFGNPITIKSMEWPGVHTGITTDKLGQLDVYSVALSTSYPKFIMNGNSKQTANVENLSDHIGDVLVIDETTDGEGHYNFHWDEAEYYSDAPAVDGYYILGDANFMSEMSISGTAWKFSGGLQMATTTGDNVANKVITISKTVEVRVKSYFDFYPDWLNYGKSYDGTDGITTNGDNVILSLGAKEDSAIFSFYVDATNKNVWVVKGLPLDAFCSAFLNGANSVCDSATGHTDLDDLKALWGNLSNLYGSLSAEAKAELYAIGFNGGSNVDDPHKVVKAYNYIVTKYGTTDCPDFIWGGTYPKASLNVYDLSNDGESADMMVVVTVAAISLAALSCILLVLKKKRRQ